MEYTQYTNNMQYVLYYIDKKNQNSYYSRIVMLLYRKKENIYYEHSLY